MNKNHSILAASLMVLASWSASAATIDGTLDGAYGSALAVQTVQTGFGDNLASDGTSSGGSELDAAYGMISGGNLYLFIAGNFQDNGNHLNLFISDGRAGQSSLSTSGGSLAAMNGSKFSSGFQATYAIDLNDFSGTAYVEEYSLVGTPSGGYVGSIGLTGGIGSGSPGGSILYGMNNLNTGGVVGGTGAANAIAASSVNTGLELLIPLSLLGDPTGDINVMADINGGSDGYLSNQFLPGLAAGTDNLGGTSGSTFDFSAASGQYFTVAAVPEPSSMALLALSGLATLVAVRRRR